MDNYPACNRNVELTPNHPPILRKRGSEETMAPEPKLGPNRGNAGKGRPKGSQNKATAAIKDMIIQALDKSGGVEYLQRQANENPVAFMGLVGKVLPLQVNGAGENGEHIISVVRWID